MKEFIVLQNCSICGAGFDSDYKLIKHLSLSHTPAERSGRVGEQDSCGCGGENSHGHREQLG